MSKEFPGHNVALRDVNLIVHDHDFLCVVGASGCGKSTLLHLMGGLDTPTCGEIVVEGTAISRMSDDEIIGYDEHGVPR